MNTRKRTRFDNPLYRGFLITFEIVMILFFLVTFTPIGIIWIVIRVLWLVIRSAVRAAQPVDRQGG